MMKSNCILRRRALLLLTVFTLLLPRPALAASAAEIDSEVQAALQNLYQSTPAALKLSKIAKGILVFPNVLKAGFLVGAQYGDGALLKAGQTAGYYRTLAASYGLQAGVQSFGYALFFLDEAALAYLNTSAGWEIGVGPSLVVVDEGFAKAMTTTTAKDNIYAFFFNQKGLMAGLGLQGNCCQGLSSQREDWQFIGKCGESEEFRAVQAVKLLGIPFPVKAKPPGKVL